MDEAKITITVEVGDEEVLAWDYLSLESLEADLTKIRRVIEKEKAEV